ncbi:hypothetical protein FRC04_011387 [Tulasnella sp. 424]|nr:hypothetical protein FRC04_011387 [Tulasnella sp. 424]KAG8972617.1 hypothetical protein FRC05_009727 [Tulasnella sp. 425]
MSYGSSKWLDWVLDEEEGMKHIKAAYDLGINAFDTADVYANGLSEVTLGKAIKKYNLPRDEIVVMTKCFQAVPHDPNHNGWFIAGPEQMDKMRYTNQYGTSRKHIFEAIKKSLERLQLDYVDVYQLHRFDPITPVEETMQALHDVVKAGYARILAVHKMQAYAREHNLTQFISMQNHHSAIYREEEREMTPLLQDLGVGMIPWSPLARGFLTRPVDAETTRVGSDIVAEIAQKRGITMAQVAVAWSLSKSFMTAPIVGTTSLEKLKDVVGGVNVKLTEEEIKAIDEPYRPKPILGHR